MIQLFPEPYPDELLYSCIARYHIRVGNVDAKNTLRNLYDKDTITAMIEMTSNLKRLINSIPAGVYTEEEIIKKNTMHSYFTSFITKEKSLEIYKCMIGDNGNKIYNTLGLSNMKVKLNTYLRFCTECYSEDLKKYGETYWHRMHQVAALDYCVNHRCRLINSNISIRNKNRQEFVNATLELKKYDIEKMSKEQENAPFINFDDIERKSIIIGKDILYLMNNSIEHSQDINFFRNIYIKRLIELGLADNKSIFKEELLLKFKSYWGKEFLDYINYNFDINKPTNWVLTIARKHRKAFHPIQHILFIEFLGLNIHDIFEIKMFENNNVKESNRAVKSIEEIQKYRDVWLGIMNMYPSYNKSSLREINRSTYYFLYKYDNKWLKNNSPKRKINEKIKPTINWQERDEFILDKVMSAVKELKDVTSKPQRITITRIGKMINNEALLQKNIDRLPKTKSFIENNLESIDMFRKRRMEWAIKELEKGGKYYSKWDVLRKAGINLLNNDKK